MLSLLYHRGESFIDVGAAITGGPQSAVGRSHSGKPPLIGEMPRRGGRVAPHISPIRIQMLLRNARFTGLYGRRSA